MHTSPILLSSIFLFCGITASASEKEAIQKETFIFSIEQGDTLRLDKYAVGKADEARPVVLFAFGGGFRGGDRARDSYVSFFHALAEEGYVVVSTDYRTTLSSLTQSPANAQAFVPLLQSAIATATADFYRATRFVVEHSDAWQIDPARIVACGSSAGAITVLQAEYERCRENDAARLLLPEGFHYAGVISFAGAIAAAGPLEWEQTPCPLLLFHGDADRIVPYEKAVADGIGLWGSYAICQTLDQTDTPHTFYSVNQAGHEIADRPMADNRPEILAFLSRLWSEKPLRFRHIQEATEGEATEPANYTLEDYIKANL